MVSNENNYKLLMKDLKTYPVKSIQLSENFFTYIVEEKKDKIEDSNFIYNNKKYKFTITSCEIPYSVCLVEN